MTQNLNATLESSRQEVRACEIETDSELLRTAWDIASDDLESNVVLLKSASEDRPVPCLTAGEHYRDSPWTRDAAFNSWFAGAMTFPELSQQTLSYVLEHQPDGVELIGGQYWDSILWTHGADCLWRATRNPSWRQRFLAATLATLEVRCEGEWAPEHGGFRGGAVFQDGISAYPDDLTVGLASGINAWETEIAEVGSVHRPLALSTNLAYLRALQILEEHASEGVTSSPVLVCGTSDDMTGTIRRLFWREGSRWSYLIDTTDPRHYIETIGYSFLILFGIARDADARALIRAVPSGSHGPSAVLPPMPRYALVSGPSRHGELVWPHVTVVYELARQVAREPHAGVHAVVELAEKACRDGHFAETYDPRSGEIHGGIQERASRNGIDLWPACRRQSWCATGYRALVLQCLMGLRPDRHDSYAPVLPDGVSYIQAGPLWISGKKTHVRVERTTSGHVVREVYSDD